MVTRKLMICQYLWHDLEKREKSWKYQKINMSFRKLENFPANFESVKTKLCFPTLSYFPKLSLVWSRWKFTVQKDGSGRSFEGTLARLSLILNESFRSLSFILTDRSLLPTTLNFKASLEVNHFLNLGYFENLYLLMACRIYDRNKKIVIKPTCT